MEIRQQSGYRGGSVDGIKFVPGSAKMGSNVPLTTTPLDRPHWANYSIGSFRSEDTGGEAENLEPGTRVHLVITYRTDGTITIFRNGAVYGKPYTPDTGTAAGLLQAYRSSDALIRFPVTKSFEIEEARLYDSVLSERQVLASFRTGIQNLTIEETLNRMDAGTRSTIAALQDEKERLESELKSQPKPMLAHGADIREVAPTRVLLRGNVANKGPQVAPGGIAAIAGTEPEWGLPPDAPDAQKRKALADWIANPANPLFSRVMVNRVWQNHFGICLVRSSSDFGYNGGIPSHPELLDWLAVEFVQQGWSLKKLHKQIVMSRTYQQSSRFDEAVAAKDANNRLLWRFPARRLTGEAVRDAMLAVSGDLNPQMYGPSFRPFQISSKGSLQHYELITRNEPEFHRRTIYRMNVNSGGDPMLEALDCPLPSVKTPNRSTTTTSLQALSLMNNAFVQQRIQSFAERLRREASDVDDHVRRAFQIALGRAPNTQEASSSRALVERHGLESLCWGIFNTSEFLYVQ